MTPVARKEIAIGMNTITLIAVEYFTRSVRIANMSPSPVMIAGAVATQIALFLMAVMMRSLLAISW
jgi:hypothetical protein